MGRAPKLRLLARLHGEGLVSWAGSPIAAIYDLDVFGGAASRTASGFLDGNFAAIHESVEGETVPQSPLEARLRLEDGNELAIQFLVVAPDLAEIEAALSPAELDLLSAGG